jgi:hypothetical protein
MVARVDRSAPVALIRLNFPLSPDCTDMAMATAAAETDFGYLDFPRKSAFVEYPYFPILAAQSAEQTENSPLGFFFTGGKRRAVMYVRQVKIN